MQCDQKMPSSSVPYGFASRYGNDHNEKSYYFAITAFQAGDIELGKRVLEQVKKDCQQQVAYYESLKEGQMGPSQQYEYQSAQQLIQTIEGALKQYTTAGSAPAADTNQNKEVAPVLKNK